MWIDFEYANKRLSDFGCILCSFDGGSGLEDVDIGCDITFNTVKNNHTSVHSKTSTSYDNMYTTPFEIMKNPCGYSGEELYFTEHEARAITTWLNRREYHKFKLYNPDFEVSEFYYYGSFNVKQKMMDKRIIGFSLTFTANSPYAFGDKIELQYMLLDRDESFVIYGNSDEYGIIYPKLEIKCLEDCGENESLIIHNLTTGTKIDIKNCVAEEVITIDGNYKLSFTDDENHSKTFPSDFNYEYFDILVDEYETPTEYTCTLPCELTISYSPVRKIGVM